MLRPECKVSMNSLLVTPKTLVLGFMFSLKSEIVFSHEKLLGTNMVLGIICHFSEKLCNGFGGSEKFLLLAQPVYHGKQLFMLVICLSNADTEGISPANDAYEYFLYNQLLLHRLL